MSQAECSTLRAMETGSLISHLGNIMAVTILQKVKVLFVRIGNIEPEGELGKKHGCLGQVVIG